MYFRFGAVAHHYNMRGYNKMIDSYNENNPWLSAKMPYQEWMLGPDFGFGKRTFTFGWEISVKSGKGVISSSGVDSTGATMERDVLTKETSICAGFYYRILGPLAPVYLSFDGELAIWTNKTRVNGEPWRKMDKGPTIAITPGLKYMPFKGWFTPVIHLYVACPLLNGYNEKLWQDIDPVGFADTENKDYWTKHGHFGIGISFVIGKQGEN